MKRSILFVYCLVITFSSLSAQSEQSYSSYDWIIQTGVGFIANDFEGDMKVPPVDIAIEKVINEKIAVGAYIGYASYHDVIYPAGQLFSKDIGYNYGYTLIGGSISNHFKEISADLDLYARVYLGYALVSASTFGLGKLDSKAQSSFAVYGGYVGATIYLMPGFGLNGEVGYGNTSIIRVGLSFRM
ncbi:MAG: hypothetical protein QHH13_10455 [Melioribacter sp.]|uniref:hypothetical protein n=1 Tax=Rosettibacter primus TaxID=3111523 RepID=UPI00247F0F80|nr:hypothetical protein [Melioribacter sp.]